MPTPEPPPGPACLLEACPALNGHWMYHIIAYLPCLCTSRPLSCETAMTGHLYDSAS
jgi:hypothetical protein